ncbi:sensor histidine kinase [Sulfurospirillum arcachonense]|uniref:sensor histidine kinase n=1 Tax=Sulfurospirillum arcachonense TaxID=57666 RepID=UPI00046A96F2|nr:HAMP domain-containing sensor histidine kinase [Sulfurospirillum arcachonense]
MFNKEGVPFFIIMFPFLCLIFFSFFTASYYLKLSEEVSTSTQMIYKQKNLSQENINQRIEQIHIQKKEQFINYLWIITLSVLVFMLLFSLVMNNIVHDIIKRYKEKVHAKEDSLRELNRTLTFQVAEGIKKGKEKDKTILRESRLAILGSMLSMIAHQWRQPLSELSGILMQIEIATRFKKLTNEKLFSSLERSNERIEYMSNTIDDFRHFYKPDKKKELFWLGEACQKALNLINAALINADIRVVTRIKKDEQFMGYPSEFAQAILNILSNAKDVLVDRKIENPTITLSLNTTDTHIVVVIQDNGGGIEETSMDNIFDPYFSTKDASKGTGLGLYIAQIIIEKNLGAKLLVSNGDFGAVFTIVFERIEDECNFS